MGGKRGQPTLHENNGERISSLRQWRQPGTMEGMSHLGLSPNDWCLFNPKADGGAFGLWISEWIVGFLVSSVEEPWNVCVFLQQSQFSVPSTSFALLLLSCVLGHSLVMEPVPSVHLLIGCFGKLLHAGLNNEERIKTLRGLGKKARPWPLET